MILRLLVVDDDTSLCKNLKLFFERQEYKVETAHDGPSALAKVDAFHPHLMFLDIGMPGMSGIEVLKQVKEKDASVRVLMITGQTEDELMRQARILGADDYVTKPFTLEYLSGEVLDKLHKQLFYELRSTTADLAIEREKLELVFDQMQEGVMLFDTQGMIFMANPAACKTLGLTGDITSINAPKAFEAFQYKGKGSNPILELETQKGEPFDLTREQTKRLILECRMTPIFTKQKERFGYLMLFRDVTIERKADDAMHRFISLISHKLRTPLVTIRAYPPLLLTENAVSPLNDFQKNALQVIVKECLRMEGMVNQLIAFSSLDPTELAYQPVAVKDLVDQATAVLPKEIQIQQDAIQTEATLTKVHVKVDPTLMKHAFRNIVENAFKFGAHQLVISAQSANGHITVKFKDNGPGIPPEDRDRIFERFYQVEKDFSGQVPGAGLGLTMVKQTVEAHGGRIWVESDLGKGAAFFVELPAAK